MSCQEMLTAGPEPLAAVYLTVTRFHFSNTGKEDHI